MSLMINTNVASLSAQNSMSKAQVDQNEAMERLTTGKRINTAADDSAGLAIANKMTSQVKGLNQAVRNANDGISMLQTAAGGLEESGNILQRMRELSVQSASGTYDDDSNRGSMQAEVKQLKAELDRIAATTEFNGLKVLDGSQKDTSLQIGGNANETISFSVASTAAGDLGGVNDDITGADAGTSAALLTQLQLAQGDGTHDLIINGQNVGDLSGAGITTLEDAIDTINDNTVGFEVGVTSELAGTKAGTGIVTSAQSITVSVTNLNGSEMSFAVSDTASVKEIAESINKQANGAVNASVSSDGKLALSADDSSQVKLTGSAGLKLSEVTGTSTGAQSAGEVSQVPITTIAGAVNAFSIDLNLDNGTTKTITSTGGFATGVSAATFVTAFNGDTDMSNAGLSLSIDADNKLVLTGPDDNVTGFSLNHTTGASQTTIRALTGTTNGTEATATAGARLTIDAETGTDGLTVAFNGNVNAAGLGVDQRTDEGEITGTAYATGSTVGDLAAIVNAVAVPSIREGDLKINGVDIGEIDATAIVVAGANVTQAEMDAAENTSLTSVMDAINEKRDQTGVTASIETTPGANIGYQLVLSSQDGSEISIDYADSAVSADVLQLTGMRETNSSQGATGSVDSIDISTAEGAQKAITILDEAIDQVSAIQGELGAVENRLDFTVNNLSNVSENASAAKSRIMDSDFAAESANLSRAQVLQQASQAMLAQANSAPKQVMSLLQ